MSVHHSATDLFWRLYPSYLTFRKTHSPKISENTEIRTTLAKELEDDGCEYRMEYDEHILSHHDGEMDEIVLSLDITDEEADEYQNLLR